MTSVKVMQVTDSLHAAGRERVAVNLANLIQNNGYQSYMCTTRSEGILEQQLAEKVMQLRLRRKNRFDIGALRRLVAFIRSQNIQILHAHGPSLFIAGIASFFPPYPVVVWHDHYGHTNPEKRRAWPYQLLASRISGVIAVSETLAEWSRSKLRVPAGRIWYVPNFVCSPESNDEPPTLPGTAGGRIVCVAHFRAQKDHLSLLCAMALVKLKVPTAHLLLIGASEDPAYFNLVQNKIIQLGLKQHVSLLGKRADVSAILRACDIGVLSSAFEGLPLTLLEYGMAGLPTVATSVGQCAEVLDEGRAGILLPPGSPKQLAEALLLLLQSPEKRRSLAKRFRHRVQEFYNPASITEQVCLVYKRVLKSSK